MKIDAEHRQALVELQEVAAQTQALLADLQRPITRDAFEVNREVARAALTLSMATASALVFLHRALMGREGQ